MPYPRSPRRVVVRRVLQAQKTLSTVAVLGPASPAWAFVRPNRVSLANVCNIAWTDPLLTLDVQSRSIRAFLKNAYPTCSVLGLVKTERSYPGLRAAHRHSGSCGLTLPLPTWQHSVLQVKRSISSAGNRQPVCTIPQHSEQLAASQSAESTSAVTLPYWHLLTKSSFQSALLPTPLEASAIRHRASTPGLPY